MKMSNNGKFNAAVPALDKPGSNILCPQKQTLVREIAILGSASALAYQGAPRVNAPGTAESQGTQQNDTSSNLNTTLSQNDEIVNTSTSIETMEPATASEIRAFNNKNRNNRNRQQKQRQAAKFYNDEINSIRNYDKFYSIQFPGTPLEKSNPIAIEKALKDKAGKFADRIRKQNKNTLLVKVCNQQQGTTVKEIKEIAGYPVEVRPHNSLNQSKGTLYSETMSSCTMEELEEALRPQGAIKIERMNRKFNGVITPTHRYIITFNKPDLPQSVKLSDWHYELIELYIPTPMQCVKCQKFGHTQKWCRREVAICARCSQEGHQARTCNNDPKCANCEGNHKSMDKKCPLYTFKSEVLATQARVKCLYQEAENEIKDKYRELGKTYSFAVRRQERQDAGVPSGAPEVDALADATISPSEPTNNSLTSLYQSKPPSQSIPSAFSLSDSDEEEKKKKEEEVEKRNEEEEKKKEEEEKTEEERRRRRAEELLELNAAPLAEAQKGLPAEDQNIINVETPPLMNDPFSASSLVSDSYSEVHSDEEDSQSDLAIKTLNESSSPINNLPNKQPQSNKAIKSNLAVIPPSKTDSNEHQTNLKEQGAIPKTTPKNDMNSELFKKVAKSASKKPKTPIFEDIKTHNKFDSLTDETEPPPRESKQSRNSAGNKIKETSTNNKLYAGKSSDLFTPSYLNRKGKRKHDDASGSNTNLDIAPKKPNTYNIPVIGSSPGHNPSDGIKPPKPSAQWR